MFQHSDGRYCGLPTNSTGLCKIHSKSLKPPAPVEEDLYVAMFDVTSESNFDAHAALKIAFRALAGNRISTKRAATFGYLAQLILLSDPKSKIGQKESAALDSIPGKFAKSLPVDEVTVEKLLAELRKKFPAAESKPVPVKRPVPRGRNWGAILRGEAELPKD
jgi:hypothetical protein